MFANELVFSNSEDKIRMNRLRLNDTITNAKFMYNLILLGSKLNSDGTIQQNTQSIISRPQYQALLFSPQCLRSSGSPPCYTSSSPFYESTSRGLDTAWHAYVEQANTLLYDPISSLNADNAHYQVGRVSFGNQSHSRCVQRGAPEGNQAWFWDGEASTRWGAYTESRPPWFWPPCFVTPRPFIPNPSSLCTRLASMTSTTAC